MSGRSPRLVPGAVGLAFTLSQLVLAHALVFAGTLPASARAHGHGHPVTLLSHDGHVDVVLHHEPDSAAPIASLEGGSGAHDGDHVVHVIRAETSPKRSQESPSVAFALPSAHVPAATRPHAAHASRALTVAARSMPDLLRSTVLRI